MRHGAWLSRTGKMRGKGPGTITPANAPRRRQVVTLAARTSLPLPLTGRLQKAPTRRSLFYRTELSAAFGLPFISAKQTRPLFGAPGACVDPVAWAPSGLRLGGIHLAGGPRQEGLLGFTNGEWTHIRDCDMHDSHRLPEGVDLNQTTGLPRTTPRERARAKRGMVDSWTEGYVRGKPCCGRVRGTGRLIGRMPLGS